MKSLLEAAKENGVPVTDNAISFPSLVEKLGFDNVKPLLPFTDEEIIAAYIDDHNLNNLPSEKWELAAGFQFLYNKKLERSEVFSINSALKALLYRELGVLSMAPSQGVSILKACARMLAEKNLPKEIS